MMWIDGDAWALWSTTQEELSYGTSVRRSCHLSARLVLELLLVRVLQNLADAARRRAHTVHEGLVVVALLLLRPTLARLVVVLAHSGAQPTRVWALFHHCQRVVDALASIGPDLALCDVLVGALDTLADAAAAGALLVHESRILVALTIGSPSGAVALHVLARRLARLARDRAVTHHVLWVLVALARRAPPWAIGLQILALGRAQTAARRADAEHRVRVGLALALLGPAAARCVRIVADMGADTAGQRADLGHIFRVLASTLAILGPVRAVGPLVVTDTGQHVGAQQGDRADE
mmetsp:Transcript_32537/g.73479  ORF Transcript_32537/g.73479 Transcript_32537/m.73479 type:complete len:293 (+) Transcript_32537:458-1336(+)